MEAEKRAEADWWKASGLSLDERQLGLLNQFAGLLREWNERINLISRKDMEALETHHLLHALLMAGAIQLEPGQRVLDVGTGGGIPGIPLAILNPEVSFFLCDSVGKKTAAVDAMVKALGLKNVTVINKRAEELESTWEFVVGRAVTALPQFLGWITKNLREKGNEAFPNGVLYLKGTRYVEELSDLGIEPWKVYDLGAASKDPYFADKFLIHLKTEDLQECPALQPEPKKKKKVKSGRGGRKHRMGGRGKEDVWGGAE